MPDVGTAETTERADDHVINADFDVSVKMHGIILATWLGVVTLHCNLLSAYIACMCVGKSGYRLLLAGRVSYSHFSHSCCWCHLLLVWQWRQG